MPSIDQRPKATEYDPFYEPYIQLVTDGDIIQANERQIEELKQTLDSVPDDQTDCVHAPYTWTIKQVVGHIIDNERVFGYRLSRYLAGDGTPLPGYDQNKSVENRNYQNCELDELAREFEHLRRGTLCLLRRSKSEDFDRTGTSDGRSMSVRAIVWLLVGHVRHHLMIIRNRANSAK